MPTTIIRLKNNDFLVHENIILNYPGPMTDCTKLELINISQLFGRSTMNHLSLYSRHVNAPYTSFLQRANLLIDVIYAEGAIVKDTSGHQYIDCIAGYGNCILGHNPIPVTDAVVAELISARPYNLPFIHEVQALLAERLAQDTPGDLDCSFIVNSGSEAVETALKLARLSTKKPGIITTIGAWHGFTFGCLSVSEQSMCRAFAPMLDNVTYVPFGDAAAIDAAINPSIGCVIIEPIQSENGAVVPPKGYLKTLQEICHKKGVLLIFDEVKTGIAKTGKLFACEHDGAIPDILVCGKALGGGVMPVGAVVAKRQVWGKFGFSFPMSSSSGAGNAPASAAALATLKLVAEQGICDIVAKQGKKMMERLKSIQEQHPTKILAVCGIGLLIGLKFASQKNATEIVSRCAQQSVLVMMAFCDRSSVLVEPPACITDEQIEMVVIAIQNAVDSIS